MLVALLIAPTRIPDSKEKKTSGNSEAKKAA